MGKPPGELPCWCFLQSLAEGQGVLTPHPTPPHPGQRSETGNLIAEGTRGHGAAEWLALRARTHRVPGLLCDWTSRSTGSMSLP